VAAIKAAQMGLKTVCVEKRGTLGGTCLNVGCIPSKALLNISHKYHEANHDFAKMGISVGKPKMDVAKMMAVKTKAVKGLTAGIEGLFKKNGVVYKKGEASLIDDKTFNVKPVGQGSSTTVTADNIIIATGSEPSPLPGGAVKADEKVVLTSTGALSLKQVPKKLLVVGGGVIGLELGSVWKRLGAEVEVVEFMNTIAPALDGDMRKALQKSLEKQGMKFHLSSKVVGADVRSNGATVTYENKKGVHKMDCDAVLLAVGRRPVTQGLGLDNLGIKTDKLGRLLVDSSFRLPGFSSLFAIGDVIPGPMLAHKAEEEGLAVASFLGGAIESPHVNYDAIPNVVYTHPELSGVGKTEEELKESKTAYKKASFPFMANSRARCNDDADGMVKILAATDTGRLLGAWIFGANAGELIAELVLAMEHGMTVGQIASSCHAHPTMSEAVMEACMAASPNGKPIHFA